MIMIVTHSRQIDLVGDVQGYRRGLLLCLQGDSGVFSGFLEGFMATESTKLLIKIEYIPSGGALKTFVGLSIFVYRETIMSFAKRAMLQMMFPHL
jgi:hypothetical protein